MSELDALFPTGAPLSITNLLMNLAVGVVLAALLRWHFIRFASTLSNRGEFAQVFPFILLTTVLIISVVKSSLALSLGLVGALSIVRFRTPIKEPEELAYLFMAIAMGLGLGADQTLPVVVSALAILTAVAGFRWQARNLESKRLFLSITAPASSGDENGSGILQALNEVVQRHTNAGDVRRVDVRDSGVEVVYFLDLAGTGELASLMDELRGTFPGVGLTFIDQNRLPSV
ncbi:MAG: DUF4956 domain-containing protein [Myxococcales bacterium]|nr:DUF4956 domain-containing protein [Myxococcales bacterium]TDJ15122.1 MAG: DUF4956 domain-containing protein [Deltaproteobacteria bacterium]